jgi:sugar O-acyltransferase (sialic acid O-acetyltransferase NeuD family)
MAGLMTPLVVWGAGGHARVVADIIRLGGKYEIVGFLDDVEPARHRTWFCGAQILGGQEQLGLLQSQGVRHALLAIGDCQTRQLLARIVRDAGFALATAVHPSAVVANDAHIAAGTVVAAGAVVAPGSTVGENVIINTCASVDHECAVAEAAHIGPGAHLGGRVTVGRGTWIGIGVSVIAGVRVGDGSVIGAGAVVVNDIPSAVVAFGVPAKVVRAVASNAI